MISLIDGQHRMGWTWIDHKGIAHVSFALPPYPDLIAPCKGAGWQSIPT